MFLLQTTEPVSNPSDGRIEALMAKLHSATMPPSNFSMARGMPKAAQKTPDSNGMNAADIGRVVQWAGQELALRDTKVASFFLQVASSQLTSCNPN